MCISAIRIIARTCRLRSSPLNNTAPHQSVQQPVLISILPHLSSRQAAHRFQEHLLFTALVLLPLFRLPDPYPLKERELLLFKLSRHRQQALDTRSATANAPPATTTSVTAAAIQPSKHLRTTPIAMAATCCYGHSSSCFSFSSSCPAPAPSTTTTATI